MKNKFKWGGLIAMASLLGLAGGTACADPIVYNFKNVGSIDSVTSCGVLCSVATTSGDLSRDGVDAGEFAGTMRVVGLLVSGVESTGSSWTFTDTLGNSLFGTFSGGLVGFLQGWLTGGGGWLDYVVDGGTGVFAGATGWGDSTYKFDDDRSGTWFKETGTLYVTTASGVPEPAVNTLLLTGLGMVGFLAYRRRRTSTQI